MKRLRNLKFANGGISCVVLLALVLELMGVSLLTGIFLPRVVDAAVVTVDATASGTQRSNNHTGAQTVFVSDTTGYVFYRDANGSCSYSKSTDSGDTWGTGVTVDSQADCVRIVVWYDQWTPGDTGSVIHIATMDTSTDDLYYNALDTSTDTLLTGSAAINASVNSAQVATLSVAVNTNSITKGTDGEVYMAVNDNGDSYVVSCTASCGLTTSWNEVGVSPFDQRNDHNLLMPLAGGDIIVINRDISADTLRSKIWNGTAWSSTWTLIDLGAGESAEYDGGMSAALDLSTNFVYLAYVTDNNVLTDDNDNLKTAVFDGSAWTSMANALTSVTGRGVVDVAIGVDQNNSDVYVAYTMQDIPGTVTSANIYYKESTDGMTSWGAETGPINSTADDIRKPALDPGNLDRLYVSWRENSTNDRKGETLDNIGPDSTLSSLGTQTATALSEATDVYLGGQFVIDSLTSNSVSSITVSEVGTIDAAAGLSNTKLFYDTDSTFPYDCDSETYDAVEPQFGSTLVDGFDAADGVATFSGSVVGVGPTQSLCLYLVTDVTGFAADGATIEIQITNPPADVTITGSDIAPVTPVEIPGTTSVVSPQLTQTGYHWRNDDGSEAGATSATGGVENTPITALAQSTPTRLRFGISVEGSVASNVGGLQLQFAEATPGCTDVTAWTNVGAASDAFDMQATVNLTDGADTTNIAVSSGGVTDANVTFLTPNGGQRDAGDTTSALTIDADEFVELEYSIVASPLAVEGTTYCFRVSDSGSDIAAYDNYALATINSEVTVAAFGAQVTGIDIPATSLYVGGGFSVTENISSRTVDQITITETGTVDAEAGLQNIELYYDLDTTSPYDCASESYSGTEPQFGLTDVDGFSAPNGSSTFSGSVAISTSQTMCVYPVFDTTVIAANGETVSFEITSASSDVVAGSGSVSPSASVVLAGETAFRAAIVTQTHYQWRSDNGTETGATSATLGSEDTDLDDFQIDNPIRLRLQLSNEGATSSVSTVYDLEFAKRVTTCSAIASWTSVDAESGDDWDMFDSADLTHGSDTTNIVVADGGLTDENALFVSPNAGVRETVSATEAVILTESDFIEYEFSLTTTVATAFSSDYCFRLAQGGSPLAQYTVYPEISIAAKRDYKTQRGNVILSGTTQTITAGVDYDAPAAGNTAFIRITNTQHTGAGDITAGGAQDVEETTAYILNPENLETSITFSRDRALNETFIDWEIVEFIAQPDTDNEMTVQDVGTLDMTSGQLTISGPAVVVEDDADVVVFVTGVSGTDTGNDFYSTQITAEWDSLTGTPVFTRGGTGSSIASISYAVVEFTGINWTVQRVEHTYSAAGVVETESITPVASLAQAFIHAQKRQTGQPFVASLGHEVYLSSIGVVSFRLNDLADMLETHTSVAWVIENLQAGVGAMQVERQNGSTQGGPEPSPFSITIVNSLDAVNNSSIFGNSAAAGTNTVHPRAIAGLRITSPVTYQLWRSDTGSQLDYRTEIVQWPVADLAFRQNYYRFYVDNDQLTPDDAWPAGPDDLGENTSITELDAPPGIAEVLRLRTTLRAKNANWPADSQAFKLQYAERVSTCTAVGVWSDVGQAGSGEIWRGFLAPGTVDGTDLSGDPPTPGDLLISLSDVAGVLVHENQSATNTYIAFDGEDVEYDWYLQHNGAAADTPYCFRVVEADGTELSGYLQYPQLRTADFTPEITNWRWYDDPQNETPSSPSAALNAAPTEISASTTLALRVVVDEQKNVNGEDVKFKLQFSDDVTFANPIDVAPSSTCSNANEWCYVDGGGLNNATITTAITGTSDTCVASTGVGCGTHNSSASYEAGHNHDALAAQEYSFTIVSRKLQPSAVYYFRLFDVASAKSVDLFSTASYPAAVAESARLVFTIDGLPAATTTAGVVTDVVTTPTSIDFGILPVGSDVIGAQRLRIDTNAVEGYQVWKTAGQFMTSGAGVQLDNIPTTNAAPGGWATSCLVSADGCIGYHTTDATLSGGSARFAPTDTYAALHTTLEEVMFSSVPVDETTDVVYRIFVSENQPPGDYTTNITYIATPVF